MYMSIARPIIPTGMRESQAITTIEVTSDCAKNARYGAKNGTTKRAWRRFILFGLSWKNSGRRFFDDGHCQS